MKSEPAARGQRGQRIWGETPFFLFCWRVWILIADHALAVHSPSSLLTKLRTRETRLRPYPWGSSDLIGRPRSCPRKPDIDETAKPELTSSFQ
jgi:hypothetical protein